jgi:predicted RNA-binding Zn ribbon-like protein
MTGQERFGSYEDINIGMIVAFVNDLATDRAHGRPAVAVDRFEATRHILSVDPPSAALLNGSDLPQFADLARQLREVFDAVQGGDADAAAELLNTMLNKYPAHPHLAKEQGVWRLHHHPVDAALVPMIGAACAEALARIIGDGSSDRLGVCESDDCDRVFFDQSKNASRRFCSTTCQNRVKAAAFRRRQARAE